MDEIGVWYRERNRQRMVHRLERKTYILLRTGKPGEDMLEVVDNVQD